MKQRLISISVGFVLLAGLMYWIDIWVLNLAFAVLGGLAIFEAMRALKLNDNTVPLIIFPGLHIVNMFVSIQAHYFVYLLLFLTFCFVMMSKNRHYTFKEGAAVFAVTLMITLGLRSILNMRDATESVGDMRFMLFIALGLGWVCDTFAFTFGKWMGKKKMCPEISPNKTVAGGIGGIVGTPIVITLAFYLYSILTTPAESAFYQMNEPVHLVFYFVMGLLGAAIGIIGDLAASFIKRECGIKDFGNIMPGHGGALDRLDSVLFTSVFAAFAFELFFNLFKVAPDFIDLFI